MKPLLHFVQLQNCSILQQLCWEEALLRADQRNWCLMNYGTPPAIVMGISAQITQVINQEKLSQNPIPIIRRCSGGGTVVVGEHTLFITFICQTEAVQVQPFPAELMQWSAALYHPLFTMHPFQLRENDYALGDKKWGGNAQSFVKGRWLHHSSLLWDYHRAHMDYLLIPPKMPNYREGRKHIDFLCCLKDYWPNCMLFQQQLIKQIEKQFTLITTTSHEIKQITLQPHRKSTQLL